MDFLGIGPLELIFILIIILLVVGPRDVARVARGLGSFLNRLYRSENYRLVQRASQELRNLPQRLAREANLEELKDLEKIKDEMSIAPQPDPYRGWKQPLPPASAPPKSAASNPPAANSAPNSAEGRNGPDSVARAGTEAEPAPQAQAKTDSPAAADLAGVDQPADGAGPGGEPKVS